MGWLSPLFRIISVIFGFVGFGFGFTIGLVAGYYFFFFSEPLDVKDPEIQPLAEQDTAKLQRLLPEIPLWVKNPDYDRVEWLNKFVGYMWPYLDKAICKTAKEIAKPIIAEHIPNYKIDSVEFETFTLGTLPPTFQGIKVYVTDEKEVILEPSLKWAANPNITIVVKAFGLRATAQVVDFQIFASPRITLKPLVPAFPCFATIYVSLMEKPHVDFGLKLLGADFMSIPGVYRLVQELIKDQVANMYLWPRTLEVPVLDPIKAQRKPVGILHAKVLRAMKLRKMDFLGQSDPYVKLKLTDDKAPSKKTTVKFKTLNPEWNEEFKLVVRDPETQALQVKVFDWDQVGKHEKMGTPAGGGVLVVIVHEAQDVEGKHHTNPFARIIFRGEKRKTKTVKKNRDPRWDEKFQFIVEEPPINDKLHIEVFSTTKRMGLRQPKESLGYINISLGDVVSNKRINEKYHLIDSKNGRIQIELQWRAGPPKS
ncbi:hypothetical protein Cgig2_003148 [Carnegiea gigantea]|uniref:Uncharacterized protein n=1 Tax=Carnegiea gigantea TaxID=171969 RepID=A0A9Q1GT30_9CARY|nr:hypothetical protein Cgig2_003148 [Carnegiea gigantea]